MVNVSLTLLAARRVVRPTARIAIPSLGVAMPDTLLSLPVIEAGLNERVHAAFELHSSGQGAPLLWWPRGYGEPRLYTLQVHSDELHIHVRRRVGFRTAVLDLERIPPAQARSERVQPGSHFRLLVNGREVYVVGTSLIPLDTLGPRAAPAYMHWLLDSAAAAHVNLLRIWGGASYPSRELLDACDQMGMLVWLDTMFAASLYPNHDAFLAEVRTEVAQAVASAVSHPSVVAVVGNNEGELYFLGGYGRRTRAMQTGSAPTRCSSTTQCATRYSTPAARFRIFHVLQPRATCRCSRTAGAIRRTRTTSCTVQGNTMDMTPHVRGTLRATRTCASWSSSACSPCRPSMPSMLSCPARVAIPEGRHAPLTRP